MTHSRGTSSQEGRVRLWTVPDPWRSNLPAVAFPPVHGRDTTVGWSRPQRTQPHHKGFALHSNRLHLSGIERLAPHLTPNNRDELLRRATHRSKREIEKLVAELQPRPEVPSTIRKLPARPASQLGPRPVVRAEVRKGDPQLRPDGVATLVAAPVSPARVEPLAPERYKVQFTASAELREKLERLQALAPSSDLAAIIEQAVTERLERLEAKRFGKSKAPRKSVGETVTSAASRYIPAPIRRTVFERDGSRCSVSVHASCQWIARSRSQ